MKSIIIASLLLISAYSYSHHEYECNAFGDSTGGAKKFTLNFSSNGGAVVSDYESSEADCQAGALCTFKRTVMERGDLFTTHEEVKDYTSYYYFQYNRGFKLEGNEFQSYESAGNNTDVIPSDIFEIRKNRLVISNADHFNHHELIAYYEVYYTEGPFTWHVSENIFKCTLLDH